MDIDLPGMTGIEALAQLRADAPTASIPVASADAYTMKDDRARILAAGFDGYSRSRSTCASSRPGRGPAEAVILVVDDLRQNVRLLRPSLSRAGWRMVVARPARGASSGSRRAGSISCC